MGLVEHFLAPSGLRAGIDILDSLENTYTTVGRQ
jgi:hypothetical protein